MVPVWTRKRHNFQHCAHMRCDGRKKKMNGAPMTPINTMTCPVLFCRCLTLPLPYPTLPCSRYPALPCPFPSQSGSAPALPCIVRPFPVLSCSVMSCHVLIWPGPALPCHAIVLSPPLNLPCPALPCPAHVLSPSLPFPALCPVLPLL